MISSIDSQTLTALPLAELVQRMDAILRFSVIERYGAIPTLDGLFPGRVAEIIETQRVSVLSEGNQRHLAYIVFSFLVQSEMALITGGMSNAVLYNDKYNEESWRSPLFRLREGALRQYEIISSRVAMEIFMDVLYFIENGKRLRGKKSKLKAFRKWLCDAKNPFHYFAHVLLDAYRFDRGIRTPEVHGTPELPQRLLLLQKPSSIELNEHLRLSSTLMGCWRPLLELLNGEKPSHMQISEADGDWFRSYMTGTEEEVIQRLSQMFQGID